VVVYVLDALRADAVGHLGGGSDATPTLDRLAAEGVTFTRHFSVAPSTPGSTAALFTGRMFPGGAQLPDQVETLAEAAAGAGYRTASFSGNGYLSDRFGMARGFEQSRLVYLRDGPNDEDPEYNNSAERIQSAVLRWLDQRQPEGRVFLYLHIVNPHTPYAPPEPYLSAFCPESGPFIDGSSDTVIGIREGRVSVTAKDQSRIRCLYTAGLAYADAQIGRFWSELQARYGRDDVAIIVTSDHGEELFDHGGVLHGYTLYDEQLHVPLILWWPGGVEPTRVEAATDVFDLHESLRALTGAPPSSGKPLGRNLISAVASGCVAAKPVRFAAAPTVAGGLFMARSDHLKLVWAPRTGHAWGMGQGRGRTRDPEYLFDIAQDPDELENRAGDQSLEAAWLRSALLGWLDHLGRQPPGGEAVLDTRLRQHLEALGYLRNSASPPETHGND
jgi:arylsulfatase A-like enzyme